MFSYFSISRLSFNISSALFSGETSLDLIHPAVGVEIFKLLITEQGVFENISKLFGAQDIQIGNKEFDKKFMIKSNDELKALVILSSTSISKALQGLNTIRFNITDEEGLWDEKASNNNFMLYLVLQGNITNINQLDKMYSIFSETIDILIEHNSIKPVKNVVTKT